MSRGRVVLTHFEDGKNRDEILAETERRWRERDSTPLIPRFDTEVARNLGRGAGKQTSGAEAYHPCIGSHD